MTRSAADIGRGLASARPARPIAVGERIHVIGLGGAGASGAAFLAHHAGALVDGCDAAGPSPYTTALQPLGIAVVTGHDPAHLADRTAPPDRVAVSKALTAVAPDHPELVAARAAGIVVEPWQQVVADAAAGRRLVAVAGTHGKSTVAGWLLHVLVGAGADPSALVGALLPASLTGAVAGTGRWGAGPAFVVEADEYAGNFDAYRPDVAILTNVDWDHPDVFADRAAAVVAFAGWLERAATGRGAGDPLVLVANVADIGVREVLGRIVTPGNEAIRVVSTSADGPADLGSMIVAESPTGTTIVVSGAAIPGGSARVALRTAGRHNVANGLGVLAAALVLGTPPEVAIDALATFEGVGRRLERKGEVAGVVVYDDYGHHPSAIAATLAALRQREPGRRVWAVYEPLTFHRTAALTAGFAMALATADVVRIADIWAGRDLDADRAAVTPVDLVRAVTRFRPEIDAAASGSVERTAAGLAADVRAGDAVLVLGGGRSYRIAELLLDHLAARRTEP